MEILSKSVEETRGFAKKLLEKVSAKKTSEHQSATIVGLYGDLGSGKTAFTQEFGRLLGIGETIASPTFVIEKIYKINPENAENFDHLIHIDAYRLESAKEIEALGFRDLLANPRNIIMIEWPEKIVAVLPDEHIKIYFEHMDETTRRMRMKGL